MASVDANTDHTGLSVSDIFEETAALINSKFSLLIEGVNRRRDWLLSKLRSFKSEWDRKTEQHFQTIQKLESMKAGIEALSIKDNKVSHIHDAALKPVVQELDMLREKVKSPNIELQCDTQQILNTIDRLGTLQIDFIENCPDTTLQDKITDTKVPPDVVALNSYKGRNEPNLVFDVPSRHFGKKPRVRSLFFDKSSQTILVASDTEKVVLIFTLQGELLSEFGRGFLKLPCGIFAAEKQNFVIDEEIGGIYIFQTNKNQPLKKFTASGFAPIGISGCVSKQRLFVIDSAKSCINVFNFSLGMMRIIEVPIYIEHPVEIQVYNEVFFLLNSDIAEHCVHTFSLEGDKLYSVISRACLQDIGVPRHFSIDSFGNFILGESMNSRIKVFSSGGDFCCAIGDKGVSVPEALCFANDEVVSAMSDRIIRMY